MLRLQRLAAIGASLPARPDAPRLSPSRLRSLLKEPVVSGPHIRAEEDLYDDLYTAEIAFHGGPFLVAQGLTSHSAHTLSLLLSSIFDPVGQRDLPPGFRTDAKALVEAVLRLSDTMLRRAGLGRGVAPPDANKEVLVPGEQALNALQEAVSFDAASCSALVPPNVAPLLGAMCLTPGEHQFTSDRGPDDGLVLTPLLTTEEGLVIANPGELASSLRHHLIVLAGRHGCRPALARLFREQTLHRASRLLSLCGAEPLDGAEQTIDPLVMRRRFTFAQDKILDLAVVTDDLSSYDDAEPLGHWPVDDVGLRAQNIVDPPGEPQPDDPRTLRIIVDETLGRSSFVGLTDHRRPGPILVAPLEALQVMADLDGADPLFLWRFGQAETQLHQNIRVFSWSTLDNYSLYREHDHSYYLSDDARPTALSVEPGSAASLRIDAQRRHDQHHVRSPHWPALVPVTAVHGPATAPIYRTHPDVPDRDWLVETPQARLWLGPGGQEVPEGLGDFHDMVLDAAAFWAWQISVAAPDLIRAAAPTASVYFSFSFDDPAAWRAALNGEPAAEQEHPWVEVTHMEKGRVHLALRVQGAATLLSDGNGTDRLLARALLDGMAQAAGAAEDLDALLDKIAPPGNKQILHVKPHQRVPLRAGRLPGARLVQPAASAAVLDELGHRLAADGLPQGSIPTDRRTEVLQQVVEHYFQRIAAIVAGLSPDGLVQSLVARHESLIHHDATIDATLAARIACFGSASQPARELARTGQQRLEAAQASRFLIEYVAATPPSGQQQLTLDTYDQLLALAAELISRATLSDAIHYGFSDVQLAMLASGRLGVSRGDQYETGTQALATARAEDLLRTAPQRHTAPDTSPQPEKPAAAVEEAMLAEFGFTLTDVGEGIGELIALGDELCATEPFTATATIVEDHLCTALNWPHDKAEAFLDRLSLRPRAAFLSVKTDALPWRYNREWSYAKRPLVRIDSPTGPHLVWGARHIWTSGVYWMSLVYSGRLRGSSRPMKKLMGSIRQDHNKAFETRVADGLEAGGCRPAVRGIAKLAGRRLVSAEGHDLGDIDALGLHTAQRVIIVAEAKDFELARNPIEMAKEADDLLRGDDSAKFKLGRRAQWVRQHLASTLTHFNIEGGTAGWTVLPVIVTSRDLASPRVLTSTMPVVPIDRLEEWVRTHTAQHKRRPKRRAA
ncbi:hypothetical protein AB0I82_04260 [Streptomyces sp. NPDC050315]|uniref:hypothetical protein n=1 Tax=Streptomyces sp. NPDC050315 TaxID=3155039 RepID=UPI00342E4C08